MNLTEMSVQELELLQTSVAKELASRHALPSLVRVAMSFGSYNERRYSRPWIAVITEWPIGGRPELAFGGYVGDDNGGDVEINAAPGSIIRWGQKDNRSNNSVSKWGVALADGTVKETDAVEARKLFTAGK